MIPPVKRPAWGLVCALALSLLCGCGYVSFSRRLTNNEIVLEEEIRDFYSRMKQAFAVGNSEALVSLFSPSINRPMTRDEIRAWALKFFGENKRAQLRITRLSFEALGYAKAQVAVDYRVLTPSGKNDFGGTEIDTLVKDRGRWFVSAWDKTTPGKGKIETFPRRP